MGRVEELTDRAGQHDDHIQPDHIEWSEKRYEHDQYRRAEYPLRS